MTEISAKAVKELRDRTGAGMMDCKRALGEGGGDVDKAIEILRERGLARAGKRSGRATSEGMIAMARDGATGALVELACETDFVARTDDFKQLANALVQLVLKDPSLDSPDALRGASLDGRPVSEHVTEAIAKLGENVVVSRVARLSVDGAGRVGGYVHAGGKLGVLVGLRTSATGSEVDTLAKDLAMHVAAADPTPVAVDESGVPSQLIKAERGIYRRQAEQEGKPEAIVERIVEGRVRKLLKEICLLEQPYVKDPDRTVAKVLAEAAARTGAEATVTGFARLRLGEDASA